MRNRLILKYWVIGFTFLIAGTYSYTCFSHEGRPIYIELQEVSEGSYILRWKIPPVMQPGTEPKISLKGRNCQRMDEVDYPHVAGVKRYRCKPSFLDASDEIIASIQIQIVYPVANPVLSTLVHFERLNGEKISIFNGPEVSELNLPSSLSTWECISQYVEAGLEHIKEGYDHLLFVLCLVFIARSLRAVLITVTGFTLGHSLTLGLASLNVFPIRIDIVEVLIPLSIMVLAAEILKGRSSHYQETLAWRHPAAVAAGFGLLHGFGFSSALTELGLPYGQKMVALLSFNLGVELGQVIFVVLVMFVGFLGSVTVSSCYFPKNAIRKLMQSSLAVYPIGITGGFWLIERSLSLVY